MKEMTIHEFEVMPEEYEEKKDDGWIPTHHLRWLRRKHSDGYLDVRSVYINVLQSMWVFRGSYEMTEWRDVPLVDEHSGYIDNDA